MNIGFFYQTWHSCKTATFEALKQFRKVYPNHELYFLPSGISKDKVDEYHKNYTEIIQKKFNITKTEYLFKEDYKWVFDPETKNPDIIKYSYGFLDKMIFMPNDNIDIIVNGSEDWYVFKPLPITGEFEVSGRMTGWDNSWMNKEILEKKFNYLINHDPVWFQHGHYMNIKLFKEKYTEENKKYIADSLNEIYPINKIFPDYVFGIWNRFVFTKFQHGSDYIYELPSEVSNETPLETFQRTNCYSRHGYKALYGVSLSEEMMQLGIK